MAKVGSLVENEGATFEVGGKLVAVFFVDDAYHAIDDLCPHMGASLGAGSVCDGEVLCPWHAWRFRVSDGTWCDNPRVKIGSYDVRVVGDEIQVLVPPVESSADKPSDD